MQLVEDLNRVWSLLDTSRVVWLANNQPEPAEWFEVWSVLVAAVAAGLALGSLLTQLREIYWSRPVIVLDCSIDSSGEGWRARIVVTNVGERAVTITKSGWWYSFGTHFEDVRTANTTVKLPHRLEPHDAVSLEGAISAADAHWEWSNPGLFRKARLDYDPPIGSWRNDGFPNHEQYAAPFVEIVQRPRPLLQRVCVSLTTKAVRRIDRAGWHPLSRRNGPKGHTRVWERPLPIPNPTHGL